MTEPAEPATLAPRAARARALGAAFLILCGCHAPASPPGVAPRGAAADASSRSAPGAPAPRLVFARDVLPILEERCSPCHFPGGRMHDRLPFEQEGTVKVVGTRLFTRLRAPEDQAPVRAWLAQEAGAPREDPPTDGDP